MIRNIQTMKTIHLPFNKWRPVNPLLLRLKPYIYTMKRLLLFHILYLLAYGAMAQTVKASNVQLVNSSGTQLVVQGGITFTGASGFTNNGQLSLLRNPAGGSAHWADSTSTGVMNSSASGHVFFKDLSATQQVYGPSFFDSMTVQNAGLQLQQSSEIRKYLNLNTGLVGFANSSDSIYVSNSALNAIVYNTDSLNTTSWVQGKLSRKTNTNSGTYFFPVGKMKSGQSLYAPIKLSKQNAADATYSVQYFPNTPTDPTNLDLILSRISDLEYWEITSSQYSTPSDDDATLSLSWRSYSTVSTSAATRDSLLIAHYYYDGASFKWHAEFETSLPNIVNGNTAFGYVTGNKIIGDFSVPHLNFTLGTRSVNNLLPVQLNSFTALVNNCKTQLQFSTYFSTDVKQYELQWSVDSRNWSHFTTLPVQVNNGLTQTYDATHASPAAGNNFYRLRRINTDGSAAYGSILQVRNDCGGMKVTTWPNPFTDRITVNNITAGDVLQLFTASGQPLLQQRSNSGTVVLNTGGLPQGVYLLVVTSNDRQQQTFRLMK
jgi:hypothetical protein